MAPDASPEGWRQDLRILCEKDGRRALTYGAVVDRLSKRRVVRFKLPTILA